MHLANIFDLRQRGCEKFVAFDIWWENFKNDKNQTFWNIYAVFIFISTTHLN